MRSIVAVLLCLLSASIVCADERPNILWVTSEDNGQQLGCYGDEYADTPNLDRLAERSLRFKTCWSNAPVCAPARTTLISGMYATSLGGQHMRSGVTLPPSLKLYPQLFREAGYYCTNNSKTDYNFANPEAGWHDSGKKANYKNRPQKDMPFFAVFNFTVSHESKIRSRPHTLVHDPAKAPVPAYHPDTPEVRRDWAQYYDKVTEMDALVGKTLKELDDAGLRESTIVFYYGDHGSGMPRSKRQPFDSGLRVPLLVSIPARYRHLAPKDYVDGGTSDRLVAFVDMAPTSLSLAGVKPAPWMQGVAFAGEFAGKPKQYLFGYRGRMDERIDCVRSCTDGRYVYMRYLYPDRPYLKHVDYMFQTTTTRVWKEMFDAGKLNEAQAKFWRTRPAEELFDLQSDPWEVNNLAGNPEQQDRVSAMRAAVTDWMVETRDTGLMAEAEMHQRIGDLSPREYATSEAYAIKQLTKLALAATDVESELTTEELTRLATDDDSLVRFWAIRGLSLRGKSNELSARIDDSNGSAAVAACE
ncbi:MAG: sulfatase, partial [Planctomycetota bacterium]